MMLFESVGLTTIVVSFYGKQLYSVFRPRVVTAIAQPLDLV
jgi:hypothetical protein